jgi:2-polyprenyl-3-methyl-5-hydroxy-6-metoxy-1,4-benzoquinol methylase
MTSVQFWDNIYNGTTSSESVTTDYLRALDSAISYFGDIAGKMVVDLGCGAGGTSIFLAKRGANVIAVDNSDAAIRKVRERSRLAGVHNLQAVCLSAADIKWLPDFDFIFGSMVLHHIEPFPEFAEALRTKLKGKGFFWENNAASRVLVWFRNHIVGRLGVPKHGDSDEFPLTPQEVDELRKRFIVEVEYPEMMLWRLLSWYLFNNRLLSVTERLDRIFYKNRILLAYSYRQYVKISVPA